MVVTKMITLTAETCISALNVAALNRRNAFRVELAVSLGVFLVNGGTGRDARKLLNAVYAGAGYECHTSSGFDYKTINRRINVAAELFERLPVAKWVGKHSENELLSSLCVGLEPYEFCGVRDIQRYCQPDRKLPPRRQIEITPAPEVLSVPEPAPSPQPGRRVEVGHLALVIPPDATSEELIAMARRLLEIASEPKELLTA